MLKLCVELSLTRPVHQSILGNFGWSSMGGGGGGGFYHDPLPMFLLGNPFTKSL